jgi:hypothetical protein
LICCTETKEGFLVASLPDPASGGGSGFQQVVSAFLAVTGLPFASVLSAERIGRVFAKYGDLFGEHHIYSTAVVVWGFLGQVLRDGIATSAARFIKNWRYGRDGSAGQRLFRRS